MFADDKQTKKKTKPPPPRTCPQAKILSYESEPDNQASVTPLPPPPFTWTRHGTRRPARVPGPRGSAPHRRASPPREAAPNLATTTTRRRPSAAKADRFTRPNISPLAERRRGQAGRVLPLCNRPCRAEVRTLLFRDAPPCLRHPKWLRTGRRGLPSGQKNVCFIVWTWQRTKQRVWSPESFLARSKQATARSGLPRSDDAVYQ